jgi:hypothetical protein
MTVKTRKRLIEVALPLGTLQLNRHAEVDEPGL